MRPEGRTVSWRDEEGGFSALPYRLVAPLRWRDTRDPKWIQVHQPDQDTWRTVRAHWGPILEAIADGKPLPQVAEHAAEAMPERHPKNIHYVTRSVAGKLLKWGIAELELPPVPDVFVDRYEVVEELGRGGMGIVWLCRDLEEDARPVAVKHAWNWGGAFHRRERFLAEEAEVMADLDHPNVARFHETFQFEDRLHLVREFVDGERLDHHAAQNELGARERSRLIHEAVAAIEHMLERGWMCLDIKTANFMVTDDTVSVKLADLGLCRAHEDRRVETKGHVGTRSYAPPELAREHRADERSLVFSIGRVYAHLLLGSAPRPRVSLKGWYESYAELVEDVLDSNASAREADFVAATCAIDPSERPATLREALEVLR